MENKMVNVVLSKRVSGLRLVSGSKTMFVDKDGNAINYQSSIDTPMFKTTFMESAVLIIVDTYIKRAFLSLPMSDNNNCGYTFIVLRDPDHIFDPSKLTEDDMFDSICSKFDIDYYASMSDDDISSMSSAINKLNEDSDVFIVSSTLIHTVETITEDQIKDSDVIRRSVDGDVYRVLMSKVSVPIVGGLEVKDKFLNEFSTPITKDLYSVLLDKKFDINTRDINTSEIVRRIGDACSDVIKTLSIPEYKHPSWIKFNDDYGRPLRWPYSLDSNPNIHKEELDSIKQSFSKFRYDIDEKSKLIAEFESIRRGSNVTAFVRRDILEDIFTQVIDVISGFSHSKYSRDDGNRLVTAIFNPTLDMTPSINLESFKNVVSIQDDRVFRFESESGEDYRSYEYDEGCSGIFFAVPGFINIETKAILDLEPKAKELLEVLKEKVRRHIDPKMNFGSCKISNITNYIKDRDSRIQFMMQLIINCYGLLDLIKDIGGRTKISLLELNDLYLKYYNIIYHTLMYTDGYNYMFTTRLLAPSFGNISVSIDAIITNIMMFKGLDMMGSEMTLNNKITLILKNAIGYSDTKTYTELFNRELKIDISKVEDVISRKVNTDYTLDTTSTSRTATAIDKILKNR